MNTPKKRRIALLSIGIGLIALTRLMTRLVDLPDGIPGLFMGIGIGIMIAAFIRKERTVTAHQE